MGLLWGWGGSQGQAHSSAVRPTDHPASSAVPPPCLSEGQTRNTLTHTHTHTDTHIHTHTHTHTHTRFLYMKLLLQVAPSVFFLMFPPFSQSFSLSLSLSLS